MANKRKKKRAVSVDSVDIRRPGTKRKKGESAKFKPAGKNIIVNSATAATINVLPSNNQFQILTDNGSEVILQKEAVRVRIPPINMFDESREAILTAMNTLKITNYYMKPLQHGFRVQCCTVDDYKKVKEVLSKNQVKYYTHELPTDKPFKVVLLGSYKMETAELKLNSKNLMWPQNQSELWNRKKLVTQDIATTHCTSKKVKFSLVLFERLKHFFD